MSGKKLVLEKATFINNGSVPVTLYLPNGMRAKIDPGKTITGPVKELMRFVPVIVPMKEGEPPKQPANPFRQVAGEDSEVSNIPVTRENPWVKPQVDTENSPEGNSPGDLAGQRREDIIAPFSEKEIPSPAITGKVDYSQPLSLEQIHSKGFSWAKILKKNLASFARENLIDLDENDKRVIMIKKIKQAIGE